MEKQRKYICIDLKSFYASVECVERGLDPLTTNLVVADPERTEKTICLAITPSMKAKGIHNRCRVFEIPDSIDYIMAVPRMQLYIDYSANIYSIYLKYVAKEDIHVYSIDEVFMDVTDYLELYGMTARKLCETIMQDVLETTGITSTCGIGTNLYLAKIAMDITAKHSPEHLGILDEETYRKTLWNHLPLTDFWRVGPGTVRRLEKYGIYTMHDIANTDEDILYKIFGIDAELLIDHAWGREPVTMADIKNFKHRTTSISSGQVLPRDYKWDEGQLVVKEMADLLSLDLVDKGYVTQSISLYLGYSNESPVPSVSNMCKLPAATNSAKKLIEYTSQIYDNIINKNCMLRRINLSFNNLSDQAFMQYDIFSDPEETQKERNLAHALIDVKKKYGKNAILKGMNLNTSGTTAIRNNQIGGHRS